MTKKIYRNKEVWLQSQINYLNMCANEVHRAREKALAASKLHVDI